MKSMLITVIGTLIKQIKWLPPKVMDRQMAIHATQAHNVINATRIGEKSTIADSITFKQKTKCQTL